jgi:hypothetical protein
LVSINSIISVARAHSRAFVALGFTVAVHATAARLSAQIPVVDTTAHRIRIDGSRLQPSQFVYQTTLEQSASTTVVGTRTISVSPATYAGAPAWLLLETRSGDAIPAADSLIVNVGDLRPVHWSSPLGDARLSMEFRGDTAYGATSVPGGRRSIVAAVPSGSLINAAMLETVLRFLPLQTGWEDSAAVMTVSANGNALLPARLSVIGDDRVRVPAGTFDCWVVAVRADQARGLYWVTKQDPIVVRSTLDVPSLGGAQLVSALTRIGR